MNKKILALMMVLCTPFMAQAFPDHVGDLEVTGAVQAASFETPPGGTESFGHFSNLNSYTGTCDEDHEGLFAWNETDNKYEYCNGTAMVDWPGGSGGTGYVATPTYSDDSCTLGEYSWDGTYYYGCEATDTWDRFAVTWAAWNNPTPTLYTLTVTDPLNNDAIQWDIAGSDPINCGNGQVDCTTTQPDTTVLSNITGVADTGREFVAWTGDITGGQATGTVTFAGADLVGSATFGVAGAGSWPTDPAGAEYCYVDTDGVVVDSYLTLFAAEADIGNSGCCPNIGTEPCVITVEGSVADTTSVNFLGYLPTAANPLIVRPVIAERHDGVWSDTKYRLTGTTTTAITSTIPYLTLRGLQIATGSLDNIRVQDDRYFNTVDSCILKDAPSYGVNFMASSSASSGHAVTNNIMYGNNRGINMSNNVVWDNTNHFANNTIYNSGSYGIHCNNSAEVVATNNIVIGSSTSDYLNCTGETYNIASDSSVSGTGSLTNETASSVNFISIAGGSEDLHIASVSVAENAGTTTAYTWDIDADSRTAPFDIGADQI